MYDTVKSVCNSFNTAWSNLPAFVNAYGEFSNKLEHLKTLAAKQSDVIKGQRLEKREKRKIMANACMTVVNALLVYAEIEGLNVLKNRVDFHKSEILYGRASKSIGFVSIVLEAANEHINNLSDYGVSQADVTALDTAYNDYIGVISAPREAIVSRKVITQNISNTVREIDEILRRQMDKLAGVLLENEPEFFSTYTSARSIIDTKSKSSGDDDVGRVGGTPLLPSG